MEPDASELTPNPSVVAQLTKEGAVLLEMTTGDCFELNQLGAEIWTALRNGDALPAIVAGLSSRYQVQTSTIEADVRALLQDLARRGLVVAKR